MRLAFMASGRGSNVAAILEACDQNKLQALPVLLISNNPDSAALTLAKEYGLHAFHFSSKTHPDVEQLDKAIMQTMLQHKIDLVVLAGYMKKIGARLLEQYQNRIINIHPALLPKFGGHGMYGMHVHGAVIEAGETETGVTIHLVNEKYDDGKILAQRSMMVTKDDTAETLAKKLLKIEHQLYPETLQKIISGEISLS